MADLSLRSETRSDRAQIILVTGFALAVAFVGLALVLNSVIFTENLATRSEAAKASDAAKVRSDAQAGAAQIVEYVNKHNETDDYDTLRQNLTRAIGNMSEMFQQHQAADGQAVNVSYNEFSRGAVVNQSEPTRNMTTTWPDYRPNWTLATGLDGARSVRFQITDVGELSSPGDPQFQPFNFTVWDATGETWNMTLSSPSANEIEAEIEDGEDNVYTCSETGVSEAWVNVSAGTLAGEPCRGLNLGENISTITRVGFEFANNTQGTYRIVLNQSRSNVLSSPHDVHYNTSGGSPAVDHAIYSTEIHVVYEESLMVYETDVRAKPGDRDE